MNRNFIYGCDRCKSTDEVKPPLGLLPRFIVAENRMTDIMEAMARYSERQKLIPLDWINEYNELAEYMKKSLK